MALILSGDTGVPASGMPTGSVIQTVNATLPTFVTSTSSTETDTGLNVSITPKFSTSTIVVLINMEIGKYGGNAYARVWLYRNSTNLIRFGGQLAYSGNSDASGATASTSYLDSPNTTSTINYKVRWANAAGVGTIELNPSSSVSTITVMEIKV